jgi:zinc protease
VIGWRHEMEQMTAAKAQQFYQRWYAPNNAVLVISGDVAADQVKKLAEKTYGKIPARKIPDRQRLQEPPATAERRVILRDGEIKQPLIQRTFITPSEGKEAEASLALEVLEAILSDGEVGRLYKRLVAEQKIAVSASARYQNGMLDHGTFSFAASPQDNVSPEQLEAALAKEITALITDGVTQQEVADAKLRLQRSAIFARDGLMAPGYSFGIALTTGRSIDDVEKWPERINAVTTDQINQAARSLLSQTSFVTGWLLPDPNAPQAATATTPTMHEEMIR